jgi:hypothetical protein
MLDPEAEAEALSERSLELAQLLDAAIPVVDRSEISEALGESRRLADETQAARAEVSRRLAAGKPAGVPLGPVGPIRRVRSLPNGRDADPHLRGRLVVSPEAIRYHEHRRDAVAPAFRAAYAEAGERLDARPALVAAARGHLAQLRQREQFADEGGDALDAALKRFTDAGGVLRAGMREGDEIAVRAEAALAQLRNAPLEALVEEQHGPTGALTAHQWTAALMSASTGQPFNATTGEPLVEAKPAREPVKAKPAGRR